MKRVYYLVFLCGSLIASHLHGEIVIKNGTIQSTPFAATKSPEEHFALGMESLSNEDWQDAIAHFGALTILCPNSSLGMEASYYLGVAYFHYGEYEFACDELTKYLNSPNNSLYMESAIIYKFHCAEAFRFGAKRHVLGWKQMPRWVDASSTAIEIYDEIVASFPCHNIAAYSLYSKGLLEWKSKNFNEAVDAFQVLIRRFPKHELAPESYVAISNVYRQQVAYEFQNSYLLELACLNLQKFERDFPGEERIEAVKENVFSVKNLNAKGLYDTGQFYERIHKPHAARLYYYCTMERFPDTSYAICSQQRLHALGIDVCLTDLPPSSEGEELL